MTALFSKIGSWLAGFIGIQTLTATNRYLFLGILITMFVGLYIVFMASIAAIFTFSPVQPTGNVGAGLALLPGNVGQCMSVIGSAHVICHVFVIKMKIFKLAAHGAG
ncbi:hypothetical protein ACSTD2_14735 [Vibrio vulnificus]|uniref:hypothetical protein n=1 Tax=Vibrio vulnificus TaxID=672 RepID=UPI0021D83214|nr:DUF5455 family protein [Vibrio vulnificus]MCU8492618.1 hypothetical protein [Vibrio vulnificus]